MQTDVSMGYFYCISKKARPNRLHDQHSAVRFESEDGVTVAELPPPSDPKYPQSKDYDTLRQFINKAGKIPFKHPREIFVKMA